MSSDAKPEIGLVVILPRSPRALSERDDDRVHDLLLELAARHPGEQDMYVVFETGERIAFAKGIDGSDDLYADARTTLDRFGVRIFRR